MTSWKRALNLSLSSCEAKAEVKPFINTSIYHKLPYINFSSIEFTTNSTSFSENTAFFKHLDDGYKNDGNILLNKVYIKMSFEKDLGRLGKYIKK